LKLHRTRRLSFSGLHFRSSSPELIIFVGLQASGKSTFYRTYFAETHVLISKDCFRNHRRPSHRQDQLLQAALESGHSIVVDNTNPTVEERAALIQKGCWYGATIIGYFFCTQVQDCLTRNQQRLGKARVPEVAIYATRKKLVPPSYAEGFDQLFDVGVQSGFEFEVCQRCRNCIP
jgi:predicted kinase